MRQAAPVSRLTGLIEPGTGFAQRSATGTQGPSA